jgi:hypothetical protein
LIEIQGLSPGKHWLKAIRKADKGKLLLSSFALSDPTSAPSGESWENHKEGGSYDSALLRIQTQVGLPPGLRPADIGGIIVTDSSGTALLLTP